jgi:hypothetical protein
LLSQATSFDKINRSKLGDARWRYSQAAEALEKSLTYNPYHSETLKLLTEVYVTVADKANYERIIRERIKQDADDMQAHKLLEAMNEPGFKMYSDLSHPFEWSFNKILGLAIPLGFLLFVIEGPSWHQAGMVGALISGGAFIVLCIRWFS